MHVALLAQRAEDFAALGDLVDVCLLGTCEAGPVAEGISAAMSAELWALERIEGRRRAWSNEDVDRLVPHVAPRLLELGTSVVLPYAVGPQGEHRIKRCASLELAAPPACLKQRFDDKLGARAAFAEMGLATYACLPVRPTTSYQSIVRTVGRPFVLQRSPSSGGRGTHLIDCEEAFRHVLHTSPDGNWNASSRVGELTINVHGFVLSERVHVAPMSVQLEGVAGLVNTEFEYCGNDFQAAGTLSNSLRARIASDTMRVGEWMRAAGWWGVFGMDFRVDSSRCWPIEINPRFQGSTWLLAEGERQAGCLPLAARQLGLGPRGRWLDWQEVISGRQVIGHHLSDISAPPSGGRPGAESGAVISRTSQLASADVAVSATPGAAT